MLFSTGKADPEVEKRSGSKHYNAKLTMSFIEEGKEAEEEEKGESEKGESEKV